jgi:hypothetical protein
VALLGEPQCALGARPQPVGAFAARCVDPDEGDECDDAAQGEHGEPPPRS